MKTLYLGTQLDRDAALDKVIHYPVIALEVLPKKKIEIDFSYVLFTSKNAVAIFLELYPELFKKIQTCAVSIGMYTSNALKGFGVTPILEAKVSTQEGMIGLLQEVLTKKDRVLYPRSSAARSVLSLFLEEMGVLTQVIDLYDTHLVDPKIEIDFQEIEEIVFTSPSTVAGFFKIFKSIPSHVRVKTQGPVTKAALDQANFQ